MPPSRLPRTSAREQPENLAILLREPFRAGTELLHERLAERGHAAVRPPHGAVLQYLDDDGTQVSELARRAHVTKQSMAELVAHLERHGYVERVPDPPTAAPSSSAPPGAAERSTRSRARSSRSSRRAGPPTSARRACAGCGPCSRT